MKRVEFKPPKKITFYVNDKEITRYYGATVEHAIIAFNQGMLKKIRDGKAWVVDGRGSRVGLGGTLQDGARIYIRELKR